jgi:cytochrome P450
MTDPTHPTPGTGWGVIKAPPTDILQRLSTGRARDRRVYLRSHPVLFGLLAATRHRPVFRLGRTVLVHEPAASRAPLTTVPRHRTAAGTTGGAAAQLAGPDTLFDQQGDAHRQARRDTSELLGAAGVERLRPLWTDLLERRLAALADGASVDLVTLATEISGTTAAALLGLTLDPFQLASAAREAAAAAAHAHLPGPRSLLRRAIKRPRARRADNAARRNNDAAAAAARLTALVGSPLNAILAVAAINTTIAALPRAAAWAADDNLWHSDPRALADELLRVTAPTPLLPRVPATDAHVAQHPVTPNDRLLLITRHAADAHRHNPDPQNPATPQQTQLVFGAGPHACPGAALARAQMTDFLAALAPYRPKVVRSRADPASALPSWAVLEIRAQL